MCSTSFTYLGITFSSGNMLTVNIDIVKRKYYTACSSILDVCELQNELIKLALMGLYS